jgi:predicted DNA-binding protein with PD1-like motif
MVLEVVILELKGISATREFDEVSKMVLLKL